MQERTKVGQFAVANVAELLERSAYYGFTSIFSLYLLDLGYGGLAVGAIAVILLAFPYIIPLLTAPLAEKLGYKPVMLVALVLYACGFLLLSTSSSIQVILAGTVLVAVGAGGFKPVATATIAHVTSPAKRSLGYTIYYTGINVGGFAGPFLVATLLDSQRAAFLLAAAIMATAAALVLVVFRNPQPPQPISVGKALAKLGAIFEDLRLLVLLLIFSGFWFLYSVNFSFLAPYLSEFVGLPGWFSPSLQQSYNPLIIILLAIPIGALTSKKDPRAMMTLGVLLYVIGFTILAFWQSIYAFFIGLFVATVGEIVAYPAFLSYLAAIAPKDRVAVYQSYGFLPLFIGFFFGPLANGAAYQALALDAGRPELFFAIPIAVGILALVAFLATAQPREGASRKPLLVRAALVLLLVPLLFAAAIAAGTQDVDDGDLPLGAVALPERTGSTQAGQPTSLDFAIPVEARGDLTFTLRWTDEAPSGTGVTNRPDAFRLEVFDVDGRSLGSAQNPNAQNGEGTVVVAVPSASAGPLRLQITLVTSGDQVVNVPLQGPATLAADDANDWTLEPVMQAAAAPAAS